MSFLCNTHHWSSLHMACYIKSNVYIYIQFLEWEIQRLYNRIHSCWRSNRIYSNGAILPYISIFLSLTLSSFCIWRLQFPIKWKTYQRAASTAATHKTKYLARLHSEACEKRSTNTKFRTTFGLTFHPLILKRTSYVCRHKVYRRYHTTKVHRSDSLSLYIYATSHRINCVQPKQICRLLTRPPFSESDKQ